MAESNEASTSVKIISPIIDEDKNTYLHYLAAAGKEVELAKELECVQKIDAENFLGWTPLMMACRNGHLNVIKLLLKHGADATKKNRYGMSVFLLSVSCGDLEVLRYVLQHLLHGGVSRRSMEKWLSPFSIAILFSHGHVMRYLMEESFYESAATPFTGITPLMFASAMENCEAFTLLTEKGADQSLRNCLGFTAKDIIEFRNKILEEKQSKSKNSNKNTPNLVTNGQHLQPCQPVMANPAHCFIISPQPSFFQIPSNIPTRKSSDVVTPGVYVASPNLTPIHPTPPQFFFPPNFSANSVFAASQMMPNSYYNNDVFNARLDPTAYLSPVNFMHYQSPNI